MHCRLRSLSLLAVVLLPCCALVGGIADLHVDVALDDAGRGDNGSLDANVSAADGAGGDAGADVDAASDAKADSGPLVCAALADGFYCGGHLLPGDPTVLYGCSSGQLVATRQCAAPCVAQASPPDVCGDDGGDGWPCSCTGFDKNGASFSTTECGKQICADDHVYWTCRLLPGDNNGGMVRGTVPCN